MSQFDTNMLAVRSNLNFFSQGPLEIGNPNDLGLDGPGFFTLRDPSTDTLYATRLLGDFCLGQYQDASSIPMDSASRVYTNGTAKVGDIVVDPTNGLGSSASGKLYCKSGGAGPIYAVQRPRRVSFALRFCYCKIIGTFKR